MFSVTKIMEVCARRGCGLVLAGVLMAGAVKGESSSPMLRIICDVPAAKVSIQSAGSGGETLPVVSDKPALLQAGEKYTLVVESSGYETYRVSFAAEWQGLREKNVVLERFGKVSQENARRAALARGFGPVPGKVWIADLEDNIRMEFAPIPVGTFMMGSDAGDADERPVHRVEFMRPYWMAVTEVTNQQFEQYKKSLSTARQNAMAYTPEENEIPMPQGAQYPVCYVSWKEAMNFCEWLTTKERRRGRLPEGFEYTLPTEAEWEYACRAGTTEPFAGRVDSMAWHKGNSSEKTNPVGTKNPNAWGLHDMHGNVWEWCSDVWYASYRNAPTDGSQRGLAVDEYEVDRSRIDETGTAYRLLNDDYRAMRGGCWSYPLPACRSANRFYHKPGYKLNYLGFRPVILWNPPVTEIQATRRLDAGR